MLESDYITTARAKGMPERRVLVRHALRNGIMPMITVLGINLAFLIGNTVVVEKVFALPGVGAMIYDGITQRDFAVVQGVTLVLAIARRARQRRHRRHLLAPRSARELRLMAAIAASEAVPAREIARRHGLGGCDRRHRHPSARGSRNVVTSMTTLTTTTSMARRPAPQRG